jgi:saccharopine dehydrogenase (NAD+, L-lysine-forming)
MQPEIVVYGATGFTGRLICKELERRQIAFAVAGRDRNKLSALAASLKPAPEVIVAALDDAEALQAMAARCKAVLACAGPFARLGRPVLEAAIAAGRHYLDITGESNYVRDTVARDGEAKAKGIALINAVGFDVVPTDAAAVLASEAAGGSPAQLRIAFATNGRPTQGTTRSALDGAQLGGLAWLDGQYVQEPVGREVWEVDFPAPVGKRRTMSVPWGDLSTAPRSTGTRNLRTFMAMPPSMIAMRSVMPLFSRVVRNRVVHGLMARLVDTLPEGPSDAERADSHFAVVAEAEGSRGTASAWVTGGDGYDFTAASAVWCAMKAARGELAGRGALTPTQAFGARALLDAMADFGVRYGVNAPATNARSAPPASDRPSTSP